MKLKAGMYVRFDWKKQQIPILIGKMTEVHYDEEEKYYFYLTDNGLVIGEDNLVKEPSYNITDLIDIGDYVNGYKVLGTNLNLKWYDDELGEQDETEGIELEGYGYVYPNSNYHFELKSIVTKEQMEAMAYKVGGSNG